jgi:hypothetical protein
MARQLPSSSASSFSSNPGDRHKRKLASRKVGRLTGSVASSECSVKIPSAGPTGSGKSRVAAPDTGSTSSSSPSRRMTGRI